MTVSPSPFFCVNKILSGRTSLTREFVRTPTWSWASRSSAYADNAASSVFSTCSRLCMTCTEISFRRIFGNDLHRSSFRKSNNSAANSTPVGPPPHTTKDSNRRRSSSEVVGKQASSRFRIIFCLITQASSIVFSKLAFSRPLTP